jgi:hypothetical protein
MRKSVKSALVLGVRSFENTLCHEVMTLVLLNNSRVYQHPKQFSFHVRSDPEIPGSIPGATRFSQK